MSFNACRNVLMILVATTASIGFAEEPPSLQTPPLPMHQKQVYPIPDEVRFENVTPGSVVGEPFSALTPTIPTRYQCTIAKQIDNTRDIADRKATLGVSQSPSYEHYLNTIPDVCVGNIIPVVRGIYRVHEVRPGSHNPLSRGGTARVICRRVDTRLEGVKVTEGAVSFAFSAGTFDPKTEWGWDKPFKMVRFSATYFPANDDQPAAVDIMAQERTGGKNELGGTEYKAVNSRVQVGDVLKLWIHSHKVVNIVPPDKENHVVGWFELNIEPEPDHNAGGKKR